MNKYAYDAFGKVLSQEEAIQNPFKYIGQFGVMDEGNGLFYMRARYYDPEVGRFISKDPIGFLGGLNLYTYVGNNPINFMDPLGYQPGTLTLYRVGPNGQLTPVIENIKPGTIAPEQYPYDPVVEIFETVGTRIGGSVFRGIDEILNPPLVQELAKVPPGEISRNLPPGWGTLARVFMLIRGYWVNVIRPQIPPELLEKPTACK